MPGVNALLHNLRHGGRDDLGGSPVPLIEAGDEGARIIGGDLLFRRASSASTSCCSAPCPPGKVAQGHRIIGAHGVALDAGLGRGRLAGAKQQDQGEQQGARQRRRKGELHLSFSRESSTGEQLSQRLRCWRVAVGGRPQIIKRDGDEQPALGPGSGEKKDRALRLAQKRSSFGDI